MKLSGLPCNSANPKLRPQTRHLEQSRRVRARWDIGPLDIFAIYMGAARAHSDTTEVLYGEAEGNGSQSIGRGRTTIENRPTSSLPLFVNVPNSLRSKGGDIMPLGVRDVLVLGVLGAS